MATMFSSSPAVSPTSFVSSPAASVYGMPDSAPADISPVDTPQSDDSSPIEALVRAATASKGGSEPLAEPPEVVPFAEKPEGFEGGEYHPRTKFGEYLKRRGDEREARYNAMTPDERERRALNILSVINSFATPLAQVITSVASKGKVGPSDAAYQAAMARQKQMAERLAQLDQRAQQKPYQDAVDNADLSTDEGRGAVLKAALKGAKPSEMIGYLENLARVDAQKDGRALALKAKQDGAVQYSQEALAALAQGDYGPMMQEYYATKGTSARPPSAPNEGSEFLRQLQISKLQSELGGGTPNDRINRMGGEFDKWGQSDIVKAAREAIQYKNAADNAYAQGDAASDQVLVKAVEKLVQDGAVMQGEADAYKAAGTLLNSLKVGGLYDAATRVLFGTLQPTVRDGLKNIADQLYANRVRLYNQTRAQKIKDAQTIFQFTPEQANSVYSDMVGLSGAQQPSGNSLPTVSSQQQFDALPSGAKYVEPGDNTVYQKP